MLKYFFLILIGTLFSCATTNKSIVLEPYEYRVRDANAYEYFITYYVFQEKQNDQNRLILPSDKIPGYKELFINVFEQDKRTKFELNSDTISKLIKIVRALELALKIETSNLISIEQSKVLQTEPIIYVYYFDRGEFKDIVVRKENERGLSFIYSPDSPYAKKSGTYAGYVEIETKTDKESIENKISVLKARYDELYEILKSEGIYMIPKFDSKIDKFDLALKQD